MPSTFKFQRMPRFVFSENVHAHLKFMLEFTLGYCCLVLVPFDSIPLKKIPSEKIRFDKIPFENYF